MTTHTIGPRVTAAARRPAAGAAQARWLAGGLALGFLVPFLLADLAGLSRDLYYALYGLAVIGFIAAWSRATGVDLAGAARRRLPAALVLGVAVAVVMAVVVVRTEESSARPGGLELAGAVLWRGVVYGAVDGLLLSVFPILAVFAALAGWRRRRRRSGTLAVGAIALAASVAMTVAYHAGYEDFRSSQMRSPVAGDLVWSVPTLVTLNPVGSPIAHVGLHVSAVVHSYDTDLFLPPHPADEGSP